MAGGAPLPVIEPAAARKIIDRLPAAILKVGVFVNEASPEVVAQIALEAGVSALQLHGDVTFIVDRDAGALLKQQEYYQRVLEMTAILTPERL